METAGLARRSVLIVAMLVLIGAVVALAAPGLRGGTRQAPAAQPAAPTTAPPPSTTTAAPAPALTAAATTFPTETTPSPAASVATAGGAQLAHTGLSPWWVLGGAGLAYLGLLVLWSELHLRPDPALRPWWGRYTPRHRRRA